MSILMCYKYYSIFKQSVPIEYFVRLCKYNMHDEHAKLLRKIVCYI